MDILSTRSVAEMLGVSEATVKRWADAGTLKCFRTAGGHRKFRVRDVKAFLADGGAEEGATASPPTRELTTEQTQVRALALSGDVDALVSLVATERLKGTSLAAIFDGVLAPALDEVTEASTSGKLSAAQRQAAQTAVVATLARVRPLVEKGVKKERGTALFAGLGDDGQDVSLRMAALVLAAEGYRPVVAGGNVPSTDLAVMVESQTPALVVLNARQVDRTGERLKGDLAVVASAAAAARAQVVVGGGGFDALAATPAHVKRFGTLEELAALTRFDAAPLQT